MVLQFVGKHLNFIGVLDRSSRATQRTVNLLHAKSCLVFISLAIFTVPTFFYCSLEADKFSDFVNSFFFTLCGTLGVSFQSVLLYGKSHVNKLIVDITEIFNQRRKFLLCKYESFPQIRINILEILLGSKCLHLKTIYEKAESTMEFFTKIIYMLMLRVSVPVIVTQFIFWSFFKYFRSGFSNDSFILIYPWA